MLEAGHHGRHEEAYEIIQRRTFEELHISNLCGANSQQPEVLSELTHTRQPYIFTL